MIRLHPAAWTLVWCLDDDYWAVELWLLQAAQRVLALGDSREEQDAAAACNIPFFKICCAADLRAFSMSRDVAPNAVRD